MKRPNILKMALLGSTAVMLPPPPPPTTTVQGGAKAKIGQIIQAGDLTLEVTGIAPDGNPIVKRIENKGRKQCLSKA